MSGTILSPQIRAPNITKHHQTSVHIWLMCTWQAAWLLLPAFCGEMLVPGKHQAWGQYSINRQQNPFQLRD